MIPEQRQRELLNSKDFVRSYGEAQFVQQAFIEATQRLCAATDHREVAKARRQVQKLLNGMEFARCVIHTHEATARASLPSKPVHIYCKEGVAHIVPEDNDPLNMELYK